MNGITDYVLLDQLGSGSYAEVYRARKKATKEIVAVKVFDKSRLSSSAWEHIVSEISLLKKLKHQHIIEMKDFLWDDKNIYIIMEYCNAGNLSNYIKRNKTLPENICQRFLQQLALALRYMRENDVCHLDLKPANLLLSTVTGMYTLKVGDFGFAQHLKIYQQNTDVKGTPLYMAPEILLNGSYGPEADLWSVGVILYECLFGSAPYRSRNMQELAGRIHRDNPIVIPHVPSISDKCRQLLVALLQRDPDARITFDKFFEDPFLDLDHAPGPESLPKAMHHINRAVELEKRKDMVGAYHAYWKGLLYLVPLTRNEPDSTRRQQLRQRVTAYLSRAEELKDHVFKPSEPATGPPAPSPSVPPSTAPLAPNEPSTSSAAGGSKPKSTPGYINPNIARGMKLAMAADVAASNDKLDEALKSYTDALELLLPELQKDMPVAQKTHLHQSISHWLEEAEQIKLTRSAQIMQEMEKTKENFYTCVVQ